MALCAMRSKRRCRVMRTSTRMIELHYGTLVEGAHGAILARLDAPEQAERQQGEGRP
jgi:hypothetical protein